MGKRDEGNKQSRVSAASLVRRARAHRAYARGHRRAAKEPVNEAPLFHTIIAAQHEEDAEILEAEAKYVRGLR